MNTPQLDEFKTTHRYVAGGNVDTKARGDKDNFFDSYDNWKLAWAYEENSINYFTYSNEASPPLQCYLKSK